MTNGTRPRITRRRQTIFIGAGKGRTITLETAKVDGREVTVRGGRGRVARLEEAARDQVVAARRVAQARVQRREQQERLAVEAAKEREQVLAQRRVQRERLTAARIIQSTRELERLRREAPSSEERISLERQIRSQQRELALTERPAREIERMTQAFVPVTVPSGVRAVGGQVAFRGRAPVRARIRPKLLPTGPPAVGEITQQSILDIAGPGAERLTTAQAERRIAAGTLLPPRTLAEERRLRAVRRAEATERFLQPLPPLVRGPAAALGVDVPFRIEQARIGIAEGVTGLEERFGRGPTRAFVGPIVGGALFAAPALARFGVAGVTPLTLAQAGFTGAIIGEQLALGRPASFEAGLRRGTFVGAELGLVFGPKVITAARRGFVGTRAAREFVAGARIDTFTRQQLPTAQTRAAQTDIAQITGQFRAGGRRFRITGEAVQKAAQIEPARRGARQVSQLGVRVGAREVLPVGRGVVGEELIGFQTDFPVRGVTIPQPAGRFVTGAPGALTLRTGKETFTFFERGLRGPRIRTFAQPFQQVERGLVFGRGVGAREFVTVVRQPRKGVPVIAQLRTRVTAAPEFTTTQFFVAPPGLRGRELFLQPVARARLQPSRLVVRRGAGVVGVGVSGREGLRVFGPGLRVGAERGPRGLLEIGRRGQLLIGRPPPAVRAPVVRARPITVLGPDVGAPLLASGARLAGQIGARTVQPIPPLFASISTRERAVLRSRARLLPTLGLVREPRLRAARRPLTRVTPRVTPRTAITPITEVLPRVSPRTATRPITDLIPRLAPRMATRTVPRQVPRQAPRLVPKVLPRAVPRGAPAPVIGLPPSPPLPFGFLPFVPSVRGRRRELLPSPRPRARRAAKEFLFVPRAGPLANLLTVGALGRATEPPETPAIRKEFLGRLRFGRQFFPTAEILSGRVKIPRLF